MSDLEKFCDFLYGNRSGYVYVPVKKKADQSWHQNFFNWPLQKNSLYDFIKTASLEDDVYISPALFSDKSGQKEKFKSTSVVWVEFDGKVDIDFKGLPEPDCVIQSSSAANLHCYWKLDTSVGPDVVEDINRRLTYFLEADSSGWDCNQVLRPPETNNWKTANPKPVQLKKLEVTPKGVESFDKAPTVAAKPQVIVYDDLIPEGKLKIPAELNARIFKEIAIEPNRSSFLMNTGYLLAEAGLSQLEIVSALYIVDCRIKKFVGRGDQLLRLSEIAGVALLKNDPGSSSYSPLEIINHELDLDWYIPGWLHSTGILILSGAPGVGKTQFALDLGYHLSTATAILTKTAYSKPLKTAVISLEMDIVELKYIFTLQGLHFEKKDLWNQNLRVFTYEEGSLGAYEKDLVEFSPDVVIIDSLSELATDDLQEAEARKIMRWLKSIRKKNDFAVIIIHHNRKAQEGNKRPRKLSDLYGSFIFAKLSETVLSLWHEEGKDWLELSTLKVRFGKQEIIRLKRTDNLTFEIKSDGEIVNEMANKLGFGNETNADNAGQLESTSGSGEG